MLVSVVLMIGVCVLAVAIMATIILCIPKQAVKMGAPEDIKEQVIKYHEDYPIGISIVGYSLLVLEGMTILALLGYGAYDAYKCHLSFVELWIRYVVILDGYKLFDMFFFDYVMLTKMNILEKLFPETKGCKGYNSFGFNRKSQITKLIVFALIAAMIAGIIVSIYN